MKPKFANFVDLLDYRADLHPAKTVFTFLADGENETASLTYQQLDQQARAIAAHLQQFRAQGERALLLYQPGLEFIAAFLGCLYGGVIAVPAYPPRANRSLDRLQSIVSDSQAAFALTSEGLVSTIEGKLTQGTTDALRCITTDNLDVTIADLWQRPDLQAEKLAFLQYTSGSTGNPKGVMVSHGNLIHNSALINQCFQDSEASRGVSWLPPYHDMGLIGGVLQPIYVGAFQAIMPPVAFLQRPLRWLTAISQYRVTTGGAPNFAYELCASQISEEQKQGLNLSSWELAFTGAEPIRPQTLTAFAEAFADCGFKPQAFYPCYGMAETTLIVTGGNKGSLPLVKSFQTQAIERNKLIPADSEPATHLVGCGQAAEGIKIMIVNPDTLQVCQNQEIGEIWVQGDSVAQGYWGQSELTNAVFNAYTVDNLGPFLRTGDLGFLADEQLFITGRLKDLIIIRGRNHYPQDIELTVEKSHPAIRAACGAAFSVDIHGEESLVVVYEVNRSFIRKLNVEEVTEAVRKAIINNHELSPYAIVLLKTGAIPKTSSGKIQRFICREEFLAGTLNTLGQWQQQQVKLQNSEVRSQKSGVRSKQIQSWLVSRIANKLGVDESGINVNEPFISYGLDSVAAVRLTAELEDWLGSKVSPTLAYDYPTILALSEFLAKLDSLPLQIQKQKSSSYTSQSQPRKQETNIAIIGMACRFPSANNPAQFWKLLSQGQDGISYKQGLGWGGFLDHVDGFDADFFGISQREALEMDPQQRILLEVTWQALENAQLNPDLLAGSDTGVFIGISSYDYANLRIKEGIAPNPYASLGNAHSIAPNRLSYFFDFRGPSLAIDTACSSSLVAVHLASRSLLQGDCQLAIAGGVNVLLFEELTQAFQTAGMMAEDGRCKTFDAKADGYVRSEGCGIVVLKPLEAAIADSNRILAVIRGSAINQDGRSNGLTAPNGLSQQAVIEQALENAGIKASQLDYIETHGTGTALGDPIEINAIKSVLSTEEKNETVYLSSVKTNIGHLEAAAGIAGLIKTVLCLQHQQIPPHLHFSEINPYIDLGKNLNIPTILQNWNKIGEKRRAGVSSFGFGGTNAHLIVEEFSQKVEKISKREEKTHYLFTLSAKREEDLFQLALAYHEYLQKNPTVALEDLSLALSQSRTQFSHRLAIVTPNVKQLQEQLTAFTQNQEIAGLMQGNVKYTSDQRIVYLFTGQGAQYLGMGYQLYQQQPLFRENLERVCQLFDNYLDKPLLTVLYPGYPDVKTWVSTAEDEINQTLYTQCGLFALEYALARLWQAWGIQPSIMIGHSVGEYVAATIAGVFSLEDGVKLVAHRGQLMQNLPDNGAMVAVLASEKTVKNILASQLVEITIAVVNGPENIVIAGTKSSLEIAIHKLQSQGIKTKPLQVSHAFHSPLMDPILSEFAKVAKTITYSPPQIPIISNLTAQPATEAIQTAEYWVNHLRSTVQFKTSIEYLAAEKYSIFLEVGPAPVLLGLTKNIFNNHTQLLTLPSLRPNLPDLSVILSSLGQLYIQGIQLLMAKIKVDVATLPNYPFQHQSYWLPSNQSSSYFVTAEVKTTNIPEFYRHQWHLKPRQNNVCNFNANNDYEVNNQKIELTIIFSENHLQTEKLYSQWQTLNLPFVIVYPASEYKRGSLTDSWAINPDQKQDYIRLWTEISNLGLKIDRLLYCWQPQANTDIGIKGLLYSLQTISELSPRGLWVITAERENNKQINPFTGMMRGLTRVIALEYPQLWGGLINWDGKLPENLAPEILNPDVETELKFEQGQRYAARLTKQNDLRIASASPINEESSYLITGGFGAFGLKIAQKLADMGAKHLILLGRTQPRPEVLKQLNSMQQQGVDILVLQGDVSDREQLKRIFANISSLHPLKGIIHAAGVLADGILENLAWEKFEQVMRPKVQGTWNLHQLTQDRELDFMILFSSVASLLGSPGQGNYATANGFLDAIASYRQSLGLPCLSINWGPVTVGMAETIKNRGIKPLSVDTALDVLQSLLSTHKMSQIAVLSLDRETIGQQFQLLPASPYLQSLIASETETVTTVKPEQHNTVFQTLLGLEVKQQTAFLTDYLQTLLARIKQVAKTEINADKSLLDLGMDSLMVMEALNQVKQDLSLMIYPREIYQHPVIAQLSAYLAREFQKNHQEKSHKSAVGAQELLPSRSQGLAVLDSQSTLLFSVASDLSINIEKKLPPIAFILSSPRSGSTLLRVMLAGHPQLVSPPELHLLPFNTMKEREESLSLSYLGEGLTRALMELEKKEQIEAEKEIQQWIDQNTPIAEVYLKLIELANHRLLIDKSPTYGMSLDILRRAESIFDGAKYIHLIRHPYAVIDSFCRLRMNKLVGLENDNPYEVAESIWTNSNQNILDLSQEIDGNRYLPVLYENLVKNPEPVMREICTFLGLEFNEAVLNPYQEDTNKSRMTDGVYGVSLSVGDPNFQKRNTIDAKLAEVSNKIKLPHILSKKTQQLAEKFNYSLPINPDYPLIETMIQGRDLNLCLCSWGPETGEIVLCVHGILDSGAMWEPVALELAKTGYRVIAPDLAGHGRSEHRNIYHFVDFIADLAAICHQLTNKPLILVGHSLGGVIGASYASIRPERVKKLVLVEPVLPNTEIDDTVSQLSQLIDYLAVRPQHPLLPTVTAAAERLRIGIPEIGETLAMKLAQRVTESVDGGVRWRWDPLLRTRAGIGFNGMSQAAYLSLLGKISAPTTLVYGDKSGFNRPEDLHKQQEAIKGGKWLVLSGGHHLHLENSTEIARLIIDN